MLNKDILETGIQNEVLKKEVLSRVHSGNYTDAILAAVKCLTEELRARSGIDDDGVSLVGKALGGKSPLIRINRLSNISEKDEQEGLQHLCRGVYLAIRNPRTHSIHYEDSEDFCVRVVLLVDTLLSYLSRQITDYDVASFISRVKDPYFVQQEDYAKALVSEIPQSHLIVAFEALFKEKQYLEAKTLFLICKALYQRMERAELERIAEIVGNELRQEDEEGRLIKLFHLIKPDMWLMLPTDVRHRAENIIIKSCNSGQYDDSFGRMFFGDRGNLGTFASRFGRYFENRVALVEAISDRLSTDWYSQNYIGYYFLSSLPSFVLEEEEIEKVSEGLAYAAITNDARTLKSFLVAAIEKYPNTWHEPLKKAFLKRRYDDPEYTDKLIDLLK